jgi:hypothetical protein
VSHALLPKPRYSTLDLNAEELIRKAQQSAALATP